MAPEIEALCRKKSITLMIRIRVSAPARSHRRQGRHIFPSVAGATSGTRVRPSPHHAQGLTACALSQNGYGFLRKLCKKIIRGILKNARAKRIKKNNMLFEKSALRAPPNWIFSVDKSDFSQNRNLIFSRRRFSLEEWIFRKNPKNPI